MSGSCSELWSGEICRVYDKCNRLIALRTSGMLAGTKEALALWGITVRGRLSAVATKSCSSARPRMLTTLMLDSI
jgi:hypothetical protein